MKRGACVRVRDVDEDERGSDPYFTPHMALLIGRVGIVTSLTIPTAFVRVFHVEANKVWVYQESWLEPVPDQPPPGSREHAALLRVRLRLPRDLVARILYLRWMYVVRLDYGQESDVKRDCRVRDCRACEQE